MSDDITTIRQSQLDRIMQAVEWVAAEKYIRAGTELVAAANLDQTHPEPAWHDRPTAPGMWLSIRGQLAICATIKAFDDGSFAVYNPEGTRWFGPIPPDPKGTE